MQQGVHQRAAAIAGTRVNHQAGRLVDDEEVRVFGQDVQLDVLGAVGDGEFDLGAEAHALAAAHRLARLGGAALDQNPAVLQPGAEPGAGKLGKGLRQSGITAHAAALKRNAGFVNFGVGHEVAGFRRRRSSSAEPGSSRLEQ